MPSNSELWQRVQAFEIDSAGAEFPFSARLARENGWPQAKALVAIEEYKKFIYLLCVTPSSLTPSEAVDQVWHLHLLYTRSYWTGLCAQVLGRTIHHEPTLGGEEQGRLFSDQYARTLALYEAEFGAAPPAEYWPRTSFAASPSYRWIDRRAYWLIPKRAVRGIAQAGLSLAAVALLPSCGREPSGTSHASTLGTLLLLAIPAGMAWLIGRIGGRRGNKHDPGDGSIGGGYGGCVGGFSGCGASCGGGCGGCGG